MGGAVKKKVKKGKGTKGKKDQWTLEGGMTYAAGAYRYSPTACAGC